MQQFRFLPTLPSLLAAPETPIIHRDLSWLQFNDRVLSEARLTGNPLLERVKFLAITASNLDEFFMIRLASLGRSILTHRRKDQTDKSTYRHLSRVRSSILEIVAKFGAKQGEALDILTSELETVGIHLVRQAKPGDPGYLVGKKIFEEEVLPRLSPPEPFAVSKLSLLENLQLGAVFKSNLWFRIPKNIPSVLLAKQEGPVTTAAPSLYFFFLDDLLLTHLGQAFRLGPQEPALLRLTRDGDLSVDLEEEDTESIPDVVRTSLTSREKGRPVRLQYTGDVTEAMLNTCMNTLKLTPGQIFPAAGTLLVHGLWAVTQQTPKEFAAQRGLLHPALNTTTPKPFRVSEKIFDEVKAQDLLLHHPYDSFEAFVAWVQAAARDPNVLSIEQTVYRMDTLSPVIDVLKAAAGTKKVRVIIELRARFDELNNLRLADELRKAGVEVAFGFGKLKLHAKIALITRKEEGRPVFYTHLSTGNYNAATARQYTDLAVLTANQDIGADAKHFFDCVFRGQLPTTFKQLVVAPTRLHRRLLALIQAETDSAQKGLPARIVAKANALVDEQVIESLYKASQAGVKVDLIIRGACSLVPGIKGLSENIRVISVVDRFLEHSRLYYFEGSQVMYLSSADWMPRNFFSRLELAFPILDPRLYRFLKDVVIPAYMNDTIKARELTHQGTWKKRTSRTQNKSVRSQLFFEQLAANEYRGTPLE